MANNGISTLPYANRRAAKAAIAEAKRQGKTVAVDGTISGSLDNTKNYYRRLNTWAGTTSAADPVRWAKPYSSSWVMHPWNITGVAIPFTPTVNTITNADIQPTITGTYDSGLSTSFTVTVDGVTYTLGTSPELTAVGDNWTLDLFGSAQSLAYETTYSVTATTNGTITDATNNEITTGSEISSIIPDAATALQIWYDGADITQFQPTNPSNGSGITQWNDKSAFAHNANPTQTGPAARPKYQTGVLNGLSIVRFDGVDECLDVNPATWLQGKIGMTMFIVAKSSNPSAGKQTLITTDQGDMDVWIDAAGNWNVGSAGGVEAKGTVPVAADTNFHIHAVCFDGQQSGTNRLKYRYDKQAQTLQYTGTPAGNTSNTNNAMSFACDNGTEFFNGDIAEVLVFNRALTATEVDDVEQYLNTHWNLGL